MCRTHGNYVNNIRNTRQSTQDKIKEHKKINIGTLGTPMGTFTFKLGCLLIQNVTFYFQNEMTNIIAPKNYRINSTFNFCFMQAFTMAMSSSQCLTRNKIYASIEDGTLLVRFLICYHLEERKNINNSNCIILQIFNMILSFQMKAQSSIKKTYKFFKPIKELKWSFLGICVQHQVATL